jgi:hypothetical protein
MSTNESAAVNISSYEVLGIFFLPVSLVQLTMQCINIKINKQKVLLFFIFIGVIIGYIYPDSKLRSIVIGIGSNILEEVSAYSLAYIGPFIELG